jgi:hypothetical protein
MDELRRIKKPDWVALFKSEPLPSSTIAGPDQTLPTSSVLLPFPVASVGGHEHDVVHLSPLVHRRSSGISNDIHQSSGDHDQLAGSRKPVNPNRSSTA